MTMRRSFPMSPRSAFVSLKQEVYDLKDQDADQTKEILGFVKEQLADEMQKSMQSTKDELASLGRAIEQASAAKSKAKARSHARNEEVSDIKADLESMRAQLHHSSSRWLKLAEDMKRTADKMHKKTITTAPSNAASSVVSRSPPSSSRKEPSKDTKRAGDKMQKKTKAAVPASAASSVVSRSPPTSSRSPLTTKMRKRTDQESSSVDHSSSIKSRSGSASHHKAAKSRRHSSPATTCSSLGSVETEDTREATKQDLKTLQIQIEQHMTESEGQNKREFEAMNQAVRSIKNSEIDKKTDNEVKSLKQELVLIKEELARRGEARGMMQELQALKNEFAALQKSQANRNDETGHSTRSFSESECDDLSDMKKEIGQIKHQLRKKERSVTASLKDGDLQALQRTVSNKLKASEGKAWLDLHSVKTTLAELHLKKVMSEKRRDADGREIIALKAELESMKKVVLQRSDYSGRMRQQLSEMRSVFEEELADVTSRSNEEIAALKRHIALLAADRLDELDHQEVGAIRQEVEASHEELTEKFQAREDLEWSKSCLARLIKTPELQQNAALRSLNETVAKIDLDDFDTINKKEWAPLKHELTALRSDLDNCEKQHDFKNMASLSATNKSLRGIVGDSERAHESSSVLSDNRMDRKKKTMDSRQISKVRSEPLPSKGKAKERKGVVGRILNLVSPKSKILKSETRGQLQSMAMALATPPALQKSAVQRAPVTSEAATPKHSNGARALLLSQRESANKQQSETSLTTVSTPKRRNSKSLLLMQRQSATRLDSNRHRGRDTANRAHTRIGSSPITREIKTSLVDNITRSADSVATATTANASDDDSLEEIAFTPSKIVIGENGEIETKVMTPRTNRPEVQKAPLPKHSSFPIMSAATNYDSVAGHWNWAPSCVVANGCNEVETIMDDMDRRHDIGRHDSMY